MFLQFIKFDEMREKITNSTEQKHDKIHDFIT